MGERHMLSTLNYLLMHKIRHSYEKRLLTNCLSNVLLLCQFSCNTHTHVTLVYVGTQGDFNFDCV